ncbi:MAG TPA: hypothetical protein VME24_00690 [Alphaproteobacteria bacterium]|nr:hypothetical protein [Alphaproteobacteria bacterium]
MIKTAGRPRGQNNRILMAFRFRRDLAHSIKKIAARNRLTQVRVLEILISRHGKKFCL